MIAIRLIIVLALKLGAGIAFFLIAGTGLVLAILYSPLFVLALDAIFICSTFVLSRWRNGNASLAHEPAALAGAIGAECAAYSALFSIIQPFEGWFIGKPAPNPRANPILLVPGYGCNSGLWWWLRNRLRRYGIFAEPVTLEPPLASIGDLAEALHEAIEAHLKEMESEKLVLVSHSMGGLIARAYLERRGANRISKLITLACPHHGTRVAYYGLGDNALEMQPGSDFLCQLGKKDASGIPVTNIWSADDNFVVPQGSSRLAGTREFVLPRLGHLSFLFSRRVLELLRRELS
jgi:triacylglycerol lipase